MKKYGIAAAILLSSVLATSIASAQASNQSGGGDEEEAEKKDKKSAQGSAIGLSPDRAQVKEKKFDWSAGALAESQLFLVQNDLQGGARDKFFNYYGAFFRADIYKYNRITVAGGLYQRFLADSNESGVRADDIAIAYTRIIPLPDKYRLMLRGSFLIPVSFISQKMGLITAARATVQADKTYGKYIYVNARTFVDGYLQQYTSMEGGAANPIARVGALAEGTVSMPFHQNLGLGLALFTAYSWSYDANATVPPLTGYPTSMPMPQTSMDPQFLHQPTQQSYGGEIYLRYYMPALAGVSSNLEFGLASGDGLTGYTNRLHDGVSHFYLMWRTTGRVYLALTATF